MARPSAPKVTATTVGVTLREWKITASQGRARAGTVTFIARNTGKLEHELVVIRSNRPANHLPLDGRDASETGSRGEIGGVSPGKTERLTLDLRPGKYVLICNRSDHDGHYEHGMFAAFTVS
jgi:uncharacterized cupredoxin-like copper-binding protein